MRIHWYWPYSHAGSGHPYVLAATEPDDMVTVQALASRFGKRLSTRTPYEVVRDLPETNAAEPPRNPLFRAVQRAGIYMRRAGVRHRLVRTGRFDVSCQHHLNHYVDAVALHGLHKYAGLVSFVHDVLPHEPRLPPAIEHNLLQATYRRAGELVVYHDVLRTKLIRAFGIPKSRIHVLPHPLVQRCDKPRPRDGKCRFLFFGNCRTNKGIPQLLEAIELIDRQAPWHLHIAGRASGPIADHIRSVAKRLDSVSFEPGFIPNGRKHELFMGTDMVILPYTRFASQSGVLADAYAYGRALIVTNVGAIGPTVEADGSGLVVPPSDPVALASAMMAAIASVERREAWCRSAAAGAVNHSYKAVGRRLRRVFEIAADRRR